MSGFGICEPGVGAVRQVTGYYQLELPIFFDRRELIEMKGFENVVPLYEAEIHHKSGRVPFGIRTKTDPNADFKKLWIKGHIGHIWGYFDVDEYHTVTQAVVSMIRKIVMARKATIAQQSYLDEGKAGEDAIAADAELKAYFESLEKVSNVRWEGEEGEEEGGNR